MQRIASLSSLRSAVSVSGDLVGVVRHLSLPFSGNVSRALEGFGPVSLSTITVTALVLYPPFSICGVASVPIFFLFFFSFYPAFFGLITVC